MKKHFFSLQWHLTNKCDQRCKFCYIYSGEKNISDKEPTLDECVSVLDNFVLFCKRINRVPNLVLTGGDPLLYEHIWEFLEIIHKKKMFFSILGNPFHLTDETCQRLRDLGCREYQMSLDGLESTHDRLRKSGSYQATFPALELLKKHGIRTVIMSTVSKENYREIPALIDVVVEKEADVFAFARYCPTRHDTQSNIAPREYRNFLDQVWNAYKKNFLKKTSFTLKDHLWSAYLYEEGLMKLSGNGSEQAVYEGCHCGISHITLLPDGTVYACRRFESPLGNIKSESFYNMFFGKTMGEFRKIENIEGCKNCRLLRYCRGCRAVAYGSSGDYFAKDPQCWIKT